MSVENKIEGIHRAKREAAYIKLKEKLNETDTAADRDAVVKKINNLRSSVRKEKKKYENSMKSGASADDLYHPKLWYYNLFDFLTDQGPPRELTSNLDSDEENSFEISSAQETNNPDSPSLQGPSETDNAGSSAETENVQCSSGQTKTFTPRSRSGKQKQSQDSLTNDHFKRPCIEDDRFDIIGKSVAIKLRGMDKTQSLISEKLINDVIFEAELGKLTLQHKFANMQEISEKIADLIKN